MRFVRLKWKQKVNFLVLCHQGLSSLLLSPLPSSQIMLTVPITQVLTRWKYIFSVVSCAQCPNASTGQICESRYKLPVSCDPGEIPSNNGTVCIRCRPGYFCRTPQEGETPCSKAGQYSLGGATECLDCPKGYACANSGSLPQPCPSGEYTDRINSLSCTQCKAGSKCPTASGSPVACSIGMLLK